MKTFIFKGVKRDGTIVEEIYEARALQEVYRRMEFRGLYPISAVELPPVEIEAEADQSHHEQAMVVISA